MACTPFWVLETNSLFTHEKHAMLRHMSQASLLNLEFKSHFYTYILLYNFSTKVLVTFLCFIKNNKNQRVFSFSSSPPFTHHWPLISPCGGMTQDDSGDSDKIKIIIFISVESQVTLGRCGKVFLGNNETVTRTTSTVKVYLPTI